jgi:hypothetical protein
MKKGDIKRGREGSRKESGLEKEKRLEGITLLPADSGSNFALRNSGNGRIKDEIKL